jgi:hypothetical protein
MLGNIVRVQGPVPNMVIYPKIARKIAEKLNIYKNGVQNIRHCLQGPLQVPSQKGNIT